MEKKESRVFERVKNLGIESDTSITVSPPQVETVVCDMAANRISNPVSTYRYTPWPANSIRLLRLQPHSDEHASIQCQLFEYPLVDSGKGTHLYEALSYVWGSEEKHRCVSTTEGDIYITENLHAALLRLRDRSLERIIWADAICINQDDFEERIRQVKMMAKIYAGASRVVVWLEAATKSCPVDNEEATADVRRALEAISRAADGQLKKSSDDEASRLAIHNLLQRSWFERMWVRHQTTTRVDGYLLMWSLQVLQEVAAARHVLIMFHSMDIDGYAFCAGLDALNLAFEDKETQRRICSAVYLIKGAGLRPKHVAARPDKFSLNIRPFGELMDMYHNRKATDWRDKAYALLGISSDIPVGLSPNYSISWRDLFRQLVHSIIGKQASVETWDKRQIAVIKSMGCVVSIVSSVSSARAWDDKQIVDVKIVIKKDSRTVWTFNDRWTLQASAKSIKQGDVVCLLQGASNPTIIRLFEDYCAIAAIAVTPGESVQLKEIPFNWQDDLSQTETFDHEIHHSDQPKEIPFSWQGYIRQKKTFPHEVLLIWDWEMSCEELNGADYERVLKSRVFEHTETETEDQWGKAIRLHNVGLLSNDSEKYEEAIEKHIKAMKIDERIYKSTPLQLLAVYNEMRNMEKDIQNKTEWLRAMADTLGQRGDYTKVLEQVATRIARLADEFGMNQFLHRHRDQVPITEEMVKEAAGNMFHGKGIMRLLFEQRGDQIPITEEVMKAAVRNPWHGKDMTQMLFNQHGDQVPITGEVVKEAAGNSQYGKDIMQLLLNQRGDQVPITEAVVKTAVRNPYHGKVIMQLLFNQRGDQVPITEGVLKKAAENGNEGKDIMQLLFDQRRDQVLITEEVVKTAVKSSSQGKDIMQLFFNQRGDEVPITEEVMNAAVGNGSCGKDIIELILSQRKDQVIITEEVMRRAAKNYQSGNGIIDLFLDQYKDQAPITEKVIKGATATWGEGSRIVQKLRLQLLGLTSQRPSFNQ